MTTPYVVTKTHKSIGIAIILTLLFGPVGLLYASVSGGLLMIFLPIFLVILFLFGVFQENSMLIVWSGGLYLIFSLTYWLINIIWAVVSVTNYNQKIDDEAKQQVDLLIRLQESERSRITVTINQRLDDSSIAPRDKIEITAKPNPQEWLKANPGKTINEYFSKFGR